MSSPAASPSPPRQRRAAGRTIEIALSIGVTVVFAVLWVGLAIGLATGGDVFADAWAWLTGLQPVAAVVVSVLILPIAVGLWAWDADLSTPVMAVVLVGLAAWTLAALSGLGRALRRR